VVDAKSRPSSGSTRPPAFAVRPGVAGRPLGLTLTFGWL
jgi:hypothetical protein